MKLVDRIFKIIVKSAEFVKNCGTISANHAIQLLMENDH